MTWVGQPISWASLPFPPELATTGPLIVKQLDDIKSILDINMHWIFRKLGVLIHCSWCGSCSPHCHCIMSRFCKKSHNKSPRTLGHRSCNGSSSRLVLLWVPASGEPASCNLLRIMLGRWEANRLINVPKHTMCWLVTNHLEERCRHCQHTASLSN